ncbi:MAG TPA: hypothetical protein VNJ02_16485 [Vicinamibacterales bacterium]|nr:hypothetical protein [Vicinamibacterales bacterium]
MLVGQLSDFGNGGITDHDQDRIIRRVVGPEERLADVRTSGITAAELAQSKTALRSAFLEDMEGGFMPRFGRANLLAAFALFDDDPKRVNTILDELDKVTLDDVKAAAGRWFVSTNRTSIDSRPVSKPTTGGGQ